MCVNAQEVKCYQIIIFEYCAPHVIAVPLHLLLTKHNILYIIRYKFTHNNDKKSIIYSPLSISI